MINEMTLVLAKHQKGVRAVKIDEQKLRFTELTVVLGGELEYISGKTKITLSAGDVLYLKQGSLRARKKPRAPADYISFNFRGGRDADLPLSIKGAVTSEVRHLLASLDLAMERRHLENSTEKICLLINALILTLEDDLREKKTHPLVQKILLYLHANLAQRITLSDVAQHCFFSSVYCDSVFKKEMGLSIIDYLIDLRLEEAKLLLNQAHYTIGQIAGLTGFSDANYFSRIFKKRSGYTPSQYRSFFL